MHEGPQKKGIHRRDVLKGVGLGVAGLVGIANHEKIADAASSGRRLVEQLFNEASSDRDDPTNDPYVQETLTFLTEVYGVEVHIGAAADATEYTLSPPDVFETKQALGALATALLKYPLDFFRQNPLPPFYIGKDLRAVNTLVRNSDGTLEPLTATGLAQRRPEAVILSYQEHPAAFESTVHHEIYHVLHNRTPATPGAENKRWSQLHDSVGAGSYMGQEWTAITLGSRLNTILATPYGALNVYEDRATMAQALMSVHLHASFIDRVEKTEDPALRKVLQEEIRMIKADYYLWSKGAIDERYWLRIEGASRDQGVIVIDGGRGSEDRRSMIERYDDNLDWMEPIESLNLESLGWYRK